MKRLLITLLWLSFSLVINAQQKPHYTQYFQNMSVLNPAVTGMYKNISIKAGMRNQWTGLESAPKTSYFTASTPINIGASTTGYIDYGITEPQTRDERNDYLSSYTHHSAGFVILNDKTGPLSRLTFNLAYAFHISISDFANMSVGVGLGANQVGLDVAKLQFENPNDPAIGSAGRIKKITPDLNAGFHFYTASFYFGGIVQQAVNSSLSFNKGYTTGKELRHYFLTTGYRFWLNHDFSVTPSVMLKYIDPLPAAFDVNVKLAYHNTFWIAGAFRKNDAASAMLGFNVSNTINLGYAYDYTTSALNTASSGTHEIVLGINF